MDDGKALKQIQIHDDAYHGTRGRTAAFVIKQRRATVSEVRTPNKIIHTHTRVRALTHTHIGAHTRTHTYTHDPVCWKRYVKSNVRRRAHQNAFRERSTSTWCDATVAERYVPLRFGVSCRNSPVPVIVVWLRRTERYRSGYSVSPIFFECLSRIEDT